MGLLQRPQRRVVRSRSLRLVCRHHQLALRRSSPATDSCGRSFEAAEPHVVAAQRPRVESCLVEKAIRGNGATTGRTDTGALHGPVTPAIVVPNASRPFRLYV